MGIGNYPLFRLLTRRKHEPERHVEDNQPLNLSIDSVLAKVLFVDCSINKDFSKLGKGSPEQLDAAYTDLISQYQAVKKYDKNFQQYIKLQARIIENTHYINRVNTLVTILNENYSPSVAKQLRELFPHRQLSLETLDADLKFISTDPIGRQRDIERCEKEIKTYESKSNKTQPKETDFYTKKFHMEQGLKITIDLSKCTVIEWAISENEYVRHCEILEEQNEKLKHGSR